MSVTRYNHSWEENEMAQYVDGDFVLHSDYAALLARHNALVNAIRSAHPSGDDEGVDAMTVLRTLSNEWMGEMMRGPVSDVEFADGDATRKIVWEEGDDSVGIPGGYCIADDGKPTYSDIEQGHTALREAVAWEREVKEVDLWALGNMDVYPAGDEEIWESLSAARAEVGKLLQEPF